MACELLDHPDIRQVLFHPRPEYPPTPDEPGARTVRFKVGDGVILGGRLHPAADIHAPVILFFHGNGEIAADYDDLAPFYRRLGLTLLVVDYRGYGISTGSPTVAGLIADSVAVLEQAPAVLGDCGLAPSRWLVMGRSLGSAAALVAATASGAVPALHALILESGFADSLSLIARLGGPLPPGADEGRDGFGSLDRIKAVTVPTLIIHGEDDWIIPFEDGQRLYEASGAAHKRLLPIAGAGHNDLLRVGARAYFGAIAELALG